MAIGTYAELQTAIANWLDRGDLEDRIPEFIDLAENRMNRDTRIRQVSSRDFTATEEYALPADFRKLISLYHDGASQFGPINMVGLNELPLFKAMHGDTGVPQYAAIVDLASGSLMRFAPEPSGTYTLRMTYETQIAPLSDSVTTNWLLDAASDLYMWASLCEAEGYLQEDSRIAVWSQRYEDAARHYKKDVDNREFGGRLIARPSKSIGADVDSYMRRRGY